MKLTLNIFRVSLLLTLIFRLFFIKYVNYTVDVVTYVLLAISLAGMIIIEIIRYIKRKRGNL